MEVCLWCQAKISGGKLTILNEQAFNQKIASVPGEKYVTLIIQEKKPNRSDRQNRYYWGIVVKTIADFCGYTIDDIHELLKMKFLEPKTVLGVKVPGSTKNLTTGQFEAFAASIRVWANTEFGLNIPEPNEIPIF